MGRAFNVRTLGQGMPFVQPQTQPQAQNQTQGKAPGQGQAQGKTPGQPQSLGSGRRRKLGTPPDGTERAAERPEPTAKPHPQLHAQPHQGQQPHQPQSQNGTGTGTRTGAGPRTGASQTAQAAQASQGGSRLPAAYSEGRSYAIGAPDEGAEGPEPLDGPGGAVEVANRPQPQPVDDELPRSRSTTPGGCWSGPRRTSPPSTR